MASQTQETVVACDKLLHNQEMVLWNIFQIQMQEVENFICIKDSYETKWDQCYLINFDLVVKDTLNEGSLSRTY